ncbi:MFS transporter [Yersinia pseudotuberculosis]|uniref:Transporter, major facilitator family n=1 Tax=Yersinia pseudotuberculosis serotype O:1b (strain IP 31758) TaxID=349747 RepID=A0A0U1R222_YERP3|nr:MULTISPECIES: MFS transporter [Yersinia pseudotuberculosis complex]AJK17222.1 major Facilitator Superfamily protein [Yersinia pseudotuberculosis str. PA3606]ABS49288.1 transporter, major facilitator family [Yersinia pseudotuberculosis IP 31758]MCF1165121.1 MFS transporter [Yersinia pseudotuberculosis]RYC20223.1 MFS transporter [Yersinia pseudotuberculosis]UFA60365.1 Major facilitator superfamily (MFS) protein [Yersinia pseudotuberculosis]
MRISSESDARSSGLTSSTHWPLAFCVGLLGIGQNGLLVVLPVLVSRTHLSLSVWAGLLTLGSMLFLVGSAWWGRQSEIRGCKFVVIMALAGYLLSFVLLALAVWGLSAGWLSEMAGLGWLIVARIIYGLTVSGMVPASQTWALQRAGYEQRMAALATISSGLSCGRLLGPLCAALALSIHPIAPLWLMAITPLIALLVVYRQYNDPPLPPVVHQQNRLRLNMLPYLLCALLLAATVSLMQLGLAPHLSQLFSHSATTVSHHVAILLSIAAGCTLLAQFLVVRPQRFTPPQLLLVAALLMVLGLGLMCVQPLVLFYLGCALASFGAAMATPGYQLMLNDRLSTGKGSGVIATSHTLGYGMSALMVPVVAKFYGESQLVAAAFMMAILLGGISGWLWCQHRTTAHSVGE